MQKKKTSPTPKLASKKTQPTAKYNFVIKVCTIRRTNQNAKLMGYKSKIQTAAPNERWTLYDLTSCESKTTATEGIVLEANQRLDCELQRERP